MTCGSKYAHLLVTEDGKVVYTVQDGIPVLLAEEGMRARIAHTWGNVDRIEIEYAGRNTTILSQSEPRNDRLFVVRRGVVRLDLPGCHATGSSHWRQA